MALGSAAARRVNRLASLGGRAWLGGLALAGAATGALAQASAPPAAIPSWAIDPTHTFVHWEVVHMGTSTIRGRFAKVSGSVQFDAKARQLDLSITIDTASVSSGVPILDVLLKGSAMLDTAANPQAFFVARNAKFDGDAPREIRGEFTLRGISQPLTLRALRWNCGLNPLFRRTVCGGDFEAEIVRSGFGITHSLPFVADTVRLVIQVEAISP
jgi:polyisoprenoid-binding protein YceI